MSLKKVLGIVKNILLAVIPVIRQDKKIEDTVILILEIIVLVLGLIIAL